MAVEAHHHLLHTGGGGAGGQGQLMAHAGWAWAGDGACYDAPARRSPCYGGGREDVAAGRPAAVHQQQQGLHHQSCVAAPAPAPSAAAAAGQLVIMPGRYAARCAADATESGVTFGGGAQQEALAAAAAPKKRKRAGLAQAPGLGLGAADLAAHFQQQLLDVDRLVLQHTTAMCSEITEQRHRHARQVVAAVEAAAAKRLRAKDEEIGRIERLNWALEERVRNLYVEAQVWRDLAQSNESAANALRGELQQALDAQHQQARCGGGGVAGPSARADDAESCCCGENDVAGAGADDDSGKDEAGASSPARGCGRTCAMCGEGAAEVLLLPCRHLCACVPCAGMALACPACGCAKNGSVCVNFS